MSRRLAAGLVALGLVVVLGFVAHTRDVGYVTYRPGPTLDVLGEYDGEQIIEVSGHEAYRDEQGALRMVTVYPTPPESRLTLFNVLAGWADPDVAVYPRDVIYGEDETNESSRAQSAQMMTSSQDHAKAAALDALGIDYGTDVVVAQVEQGGASDGKLRNDDVITSVDGDRVGDATDLVEMVRAITPGTKVQIGYQRNGKRRTATITTRAADDVPTASRIQVSIRERYDFPFDVEVNLPDTIGGPSAGMMFALAIYDVLTPGSLTGGRQIAGSGEITADGVVGAIGGIGQKIVGAQRDGARLFLVAEENCDEAARAHYDPRKTRLVRVHTLADAIKDVEAWAEDTSVELPTCAAS